MKKLLVVFLFCAFFACTCFAFNWEQVDIDGKQFVDTTSIQKYNYKYSIGSETNDYYSLWTKALNKNDEAGKEAEKILKKKWWYSLDKVIINCNNEQYASKSRVFYDLNKKPIFGGSYETDDVLLEWQSIVPGTVGEAWYDYACTNSTNYSNSNSKNTPSNVKIKIKSGKSKRLLSI